MVLFYTLVFGNIFYVGYLRLNSQDVDLISDVHNHFKFKGSIVIVDDTVNVDPEVRESLMKNEQSVLR